MKADLHIHCHYSEDSWAKIEDIIETAVKNGIGCIAITDHDEFSAHLDIHDERVIVIPAEEVSSAEGHILAYGIDRRIPRGMGVKETIDAIHEAGGIAIAAHPYRYHSGLGEDNVIPEFDGVEALNGWSKRKDNDRSDALAHSFGKIITAGSDAHVAHRVGESYVVIPDTVTTWQEALEAIKAGVESYHSVNRTTVQTIQYVIKSTLLWFKRGGRRMPRESDRPSIASSRRNPKGPRNLLRR